MDLDWIWFKDDGLVVAIFMKMFRKASGKFPKFYFFGKVITLGRSHSRHCGVKSYFLLSFLST